MQFDEEGVGHNVNMGDGADAFADAPQVLGGPIAEALYHASMQEQASPDLTGPKGLPTLAESMKTMPTKRKPPPKNAAAKSATASSGASAHNDDSNASISADDENRTKQWPRLHRHPRRQTHR